MKELLSIEEKAKRYDKALENIKKLVSCGLIYEDAAIQVFSELKESEDEKTKRILHSISSKISFHLRDIFTEEEFQCFDAWSNAWLEKQGEQKPTIEMKTPEESLGIDSDTYNKIVDECVYGEQKPATWSEEDESNLDLVIYYIRREPYLERNVEPIVDWLRTLKDRIQPKQEWNEEDENNILFLTSVIEECFKDKEKITLYSDTVCAHFTKEDVIDRLKSLKPQKRWKPSDEQMAALNDINVTGSISYVGQGQELINLYNDLKKLK